METMTQEKSCIELKQYMSCIYQEIFKMVNKLFFLSENIKMIKISNKQKIKINKQEKPSKYETHRSY